MPILPLDVYYWVYKEFSFQDATTVIEKLENRVETGYSYVPQYTRAIAYFSDGSIEKFNALFSIDDPRDVITWENRNPGNFEHWFSIRLDQIKGFQEAVEKHFENEIILEDYLKEPYWHAVEQEDESVIKSIFDSLKGDLDVGYLDIELIEIFGKNLPQLPTAYIEFLRTMGKKNRIFSGESYDPKDLEEYQAGYLRSMYIDEVFEEQKVFVDQFIVFVSSQGCNWLMFKRDDCFDPVVYIANEIDPIPKVYFDRFTDMIKHLKEIIERIRPTQAS